MILALDDDVPDSVVGGDPDPGSRPGPVDDPARERALSAGGSRLIPDGLDATLVLIRHGESTFIVEGRFQGQAETPLSPTGLRQASLVAERLASPHDPPALPLPGGAPIELVHSPLARTAQTAEAIARCDRGPRRDRRPPGRAALPRDRSGRMGGAPSRRDRPNAMAPSWRPGAEPRSMAWAPGGESLARGRRHASGRRWTAMLARLAEGRPAGTHDRPRCQAMPTPSRTIRGRSSSATTASSRWPVDAVRPAAGAVLDVVDGPVRDHRHRVPCRTPGPARSQPDGASRRPRGRTRARSRWRTAAAAARSECSRRDGRRAPPVRAPATSTPDAPPRRAPAAAAFLAPEGQPEQADPKAALRGAQRPRAVRRRAACAHRPTRPSPGRRSPARAGRSAGRRQASRHTRTRSGPAGARTRTATRGG